MERRNSRAFGLVKAAVLGVLLALFTWQAYEVGQGVSRHGSFRAYWEARQKSKELQRAVDLINTYYVDGEMVEQGRMNETAIESIISGLDPYSEYLSPDKLSLLKEQTDQEFGGIGVKIEMKDNRLTIVAPIDGTPGARAGLLRGDQIRAVDGENIDGQPIGESLRRIKGHPGSPVLLSIFRPRSEESFDVTVVRELIAVDNVVDAKMLEDGIGYLRILQFGARTGEELVAAIDGLERQGMVRLVIDLRNNPGGLLDVAVAVASPFLDPGDLVVYTVGRQKSQDERWSVGRGDHRYDFPMALLVNSGSASASEIVSGALKDHGRAVLIGEKTFGKGSVQSIIGLGEDSGLRLTTAKYYTPGGYVIHGNGIKPDIEIDLSLEEERMLAIQRNRLDLMSRDEFVKEFQFEPIVDRQLNAAIYYLRAQPVE